MSDYLDLAKKAMTDRRPDGLKAGSFIRWQGIDGKVRGPATVEHVTLCDGRAWALVRYDGIDRWVSEVIITAVETGDGTDA